MQIESFTFKKNESYASDRPNEFVGKVTLSGPTGRQELNLSTATLVTVMHAIRADVIATSKRNADMAKDAMDEAIHGPLLNNSMETPIAIPA